MLFSCSVPLGAYTLKHSTSVLKTTQFGFFGNPALGKFWPEHMLGYFDPAVWVMLGCLFESKIIILLA